MTEENTQTENPKADTNTIQINFYEFDTKKVKLDLERPNEIIVNNSSNELSE